jgi:hypothetical protein
MPKFEAQELPKHYEFVSTSLRFRTKLGFKQGFILPDSSIRTQCGNEFAMFDDVTSKLALTHSFNADRYVLDHLN